MENILLNNIELYDKDIFSRNILFHNEIVRISEKCLQQNIKLILLKGAAMIEIFPEYSFVRELEDIDVLVRKKAYKEFKILLSELGYEEVLYDPHAMFNKQKNVQIDIETKLWYLNEKDNVKIINSAIHLTQYGSLTNCYVLKPQDMLYNIYIHSYIHHAKFDPKWQKDIQLLKKRFKLRKIETKFKDRYKFFLNSNIVYKGYVLRFLFLPFKQKINYLIETLFPPVEFVFLRYGIKHQRYGIMYSFVVAFLYIKRWISLIFKTINFFNNILKSLFATKSLTHI